jgi:uncharacterized protein (DUF885 family)
LADFAANAPVATARDRTNALQTWTEAPKFIAAEIANLREGVASGYTVPSSILDRVLRQVSRILADPKLLDSPAERSSDSDFAAKFRIVTARQVQPALRRFRDFLARHYSRHARTSLGISALPNGRACYAAYLRRYSTLQITPREVYGKGQATVAENTAAIEVLGRKLFATADLREIIRRSRSSADNRFKSKQELLAYAHQLLKRASKQSKMLFENPPAQEVIIKPLPTYQENSGVSSHYEPESEVSRPAIFWISLDDWNEQTRAAVEITVVHETFPGHHVQSAIARRDGPKSPLSGLISNAAYLEGWAHYAEQLAEEVGIDDDDYERIQRRVLLGRSLVFDSGINAFGWSRQRAEKYAMQVGISRQAADDAIDRVVVEPGQLTSYELGGFAINSLRQQEQQRLGAKFNAKRFHQDILEHGVVPLNAMPELFARSQIR